MPGPGAATQTILGANGVIGRELSRALAEAALPVRQVGRTPRRVSPDDELHPADLLDPEATARAVAGSAVAYLVAGLPYRASVWEDLWPRVMRNVIAACRTHGARLVYLDNVYAYGRVVGAMTEATPFDPVSRKGEVRARIATDLLDAVRRGDLQAAIVRSADFYGPGAVNGLARALVFDRLKAGKPPRWIGNPEAIHSFTYTPDAGRAIAVIGRSPRAFGETWHLPTSGEPITGARFAGLACALAGQAGRLEVTPRWMLRVLECLIPDLRENRELMYQFESDYRFDSGKIERVFGLGATPYADGIARTLVIGDD